MDTPRFLRRFSAALSALFLAAACAVFTVDYETSPPPPLFFDILPGSNSFFYRANFYLPLLVCALALAGCYFGRGFVLRGLCVVLSAAAASIAVYVLDGLFTVNLLVYSAHVLVMAASFSRPKNLVLAGLSIAFFAAASCRPTALGLAAWGLSFPAYTAGEITLLALFLALLAVAASYALFLAERLAARNAMVAHLNQVSTKMTLFNHRLQEFVKQRGEEIVREDRLRFTSDLHDSCGYVFTNIIAITDAALSWPAIDNTGDSNNDSQRVQDTLQVIQKQAREGLQRTREILHMIREIQDPAFGSIETLYEMKAIMEEVTGLSVEIEKGNMKTDYGRTINKAITRTVQEAFTNSVRHGQASRIVIHFWESDESLEMTVRDNGKGAANIVKGIGFAGMEERLAAVGGTLEAYSPLDGGFTLKVTIPLVAAPETLAAAPEEQYA